MCSTTIRWAAFSKYMANSKTFYGYTKDKLARWQKESLSATQRQQTEQMAAHLSQLKPGLSKILEIAADLKDKTIESVLGKSDAELALEILSGQRKPPI